MGIGYNDTVIVYNRHFDDTLETEYYFGTRLKNVRIELTQGENVNKSGMKDADTFLVKIPNNGVLPYIPPAEWQEMSEQDKSNHVTFQQNDYDFVAIEKKAGLRIDRKLPEGVISSDEYPGGFFQYMASEKGNVYKVTTVSEYSLIPRFEIGGR